MGHIFHSSFSSKWNGAVIIVKKKSFVLVNEVRDNEGRMVCIEAIISGTKMVLCSVYYMQYNKYLQVGRYLVIDNPSGKGLDLLLPLPEMIFQN